MRPTTRTRPIASGAASAPSSRSIASSAASESLSPSGPKNLMPLSCQGLCEAEITAARSEPARPVASGAAGAADRERAGGGRQDAAERRLAARGGDAGGQRGLEHLARLAGVADDQH